MLEELDRSLVLDPDWSTPRDKVNSTWQFLTTLAALVSCKVHSPVEKYSRESVILNTKYPIVARANLDIS